VSIRDDVLAALREAGADGVSGEELAARFGVSRVAIGKHVTVLRAAGYRVDASPGRGYAFVSVPDAPLPAEVRRHLSTSGWVRLEGGGVTGSTNADAAALARAGAPHGSAVLAARQTAGRGRLGRDWASPEGGVYVSAVLRPALSPAALTGLPLAIAVGIAGELGRLGVDPGVKWPNDLLVGEVKLAGVLLEMAGEADRTEWVVAGVGLNVRRPQESLPGAAYLEDFADDIGLAEAAAISLDGIVRGYGRLVDEGFEVVREAFEARDVLAGREVQVADVRGQPLAEGRASGVDEEGRLLVVSDFGPDEKTLAFAAGDVTLSTDEAGARGCR